jgi:hypothetical protein
MLKPFIFALGLILYVANSSGIQNFCYGKWKLRYTNDYNLKGNHYLIIKDDNTIKFKSLINEGILVKKHSRTGNFSVIETDKNNFNIEFTYNKKNIYFYSLFGIKIPDYKKDSNILYFKEKTYHCEINIYSLFVKDIEYNYIYIFDIDFSNSELPRIEISFEYLLFTQMISLMVEFIKNNH